jgi:P-type Mg2+ transporter
VTIPQTPFWHSDIQDLLGRLNATTKGLTSDEAGRRLATYGLNSLKPSHGGGTAALFLRQFKSPIILILLFAAGLSFYLHDSTNALIVIGIVAVSGGLSFWQENGATKAVEKLLATVQTQAEVLRDGAFAKVAVDQVAPGDIVRLSAGSGIPGDCRILESNDLFVDESTLTGETFPAEKTAAPVPAEAPLAKRSDALFMGTHVVSGSATALVVNTGCRTEFGQISEHLKLRPAETEFERGIHRFGDLLMEVTAVLLVVIFAINVVLHRPALESFMFALALAVGLTPQLLPAIISVNLAHGAKRMAAARVIVRRLASIENYGSMNVLCSDKTGTLTESILQLTSAQDPDGKESERVFLYAYLNSAYETGFANPVDEAIRSHEHPDVSSYRKVDEIPYDFIRRRLSILVEHEGTRLLVTKGAFQSVLDVCTQVMASDGTARPIAPAREALLARYGELSAQGLRTLGIACRSMAPDELINKDHETNMTFLGFLAFADQPKPGVAQTIERLRSLGISLRMITGDNALIATQVARAVGLSQQAALSGAEIAQMSDEALVSRAQRVDVFAEVEPNQKERIIKALQKAGNVVGYMGDGINDASALHAADVSISVDSAADAAKEAADIVLLEKSLAVLEEGVREGRRTFANTRKYVLMAASANFGNMFSMAGASLFLNFLPLLPKQVLLTNLMTDCPEMTIATDNVDPEFVMVPRRWDVGFIRRFMLWFGLLSSVFDYLTFAALLWVFHAGAEDFRTGWFVESVVSASLVVLVVRTRRAFFASRPGSYLAWACALAALAAVILPYTPVGGVLGFKPPALPLLLTMLAIAALYILTAEGAKRLFFRRYPG